MANHTGGVWLHKTTSWINGVPLSITILTEKENHMTGKSIAIIEPQIGEYDHKGLDRYHYSQEESEANAAYIVKAVNAYQSHLDLLKMVLWDMDNGEAEAQRQGKPRYITRKERIEAAIAAAENP